MFTLRKLGLALEAERKWPEAESVHRETLTISSKKGDEDPEALADSEKLIRVLLAQKKFVEAQQILDRILTPAFLAKPSSGNLLFQRLNVMGRRGRWREAIVDARLQLDNQPADHYNYHTLVALLAMTGDRTGYKQVCQRMVTKFADSANPYIAERVAQDCLLLPESGADLMLIDKLADRAVTSGSGTDGLPYFQTCKAMSHYRLGNFREAIEWAEKSTKSPTAEPPAKAKAFAVSAMANWQMGHKDAARATLASGDTLAPSLSLERDANDLGESWVAWLLARISLDEATKLLETGLTNQPNQNAK